MTDRPLCRVPIVLLAAGALTLGPASAHPQAGEETMDYQVELKTVEPQPVLSVRGPTTLDDVSSAIAERTGSVWQHLQEAGVQPAGPPYFWRLAIERASGTREWILLDYVEFE